MSATLLVAAGVAVAVLFAAVAAAARQPQEEALVVAPSSPATGASVDVRAAVMPVPKPQPGEARYGIDVSWPQCGASLPKVRLDFAVIGVSYGYATTTNPCLADQVAWAHRTGARLSLYAVPNTPDATTLARGAVIGHCGASDTTCRQYHAGVVQATHALTAAKRAHLSAATWWLDVEESIYGTLWSTDTTANRALLHGWIDTLEGAGVHVGLYSTVGYWSQVTGDWQVGLPQWFAIGEAGLDAARAGCASGFSSGPVVLTQWLTGPVDGDLVCPGNRSLALELFGRWRRVTTAGVPEVLTIPVPHPHPTLPGDVAHKAHKRKKDVGRAGRSPSATPHPTSHHPADKPTHRPAPRPGSPTHRPTTGPTSGTGHPTSPPKPSPTPTPTPSPTAGSTAASPATATAAP